MTDPGEMDEQATEPREGQPEAAAGARDRGSGEDEREAVDPLLEELEELRDRHLRLAAEFENYRKRTRRELLETREAGKAELARSLLDALDDLGRLAAIAEDSTTVEALHEGIELVERKLVKEMEEAGLSPIEAEGEPFDPNLHDALTTVPTDRPEEDDRISRVFVPGYTFGDRLLRPARVEVKKYDAGEGRRGTGDPDA